MPASPRPISSRRARSQRGFGAIELRIPETWRVSMQGTAVFGAYEDKTIPPRPDPGIQTPTLADQRRHRFRRSFVRN